MHKGIVYPGEHKPIVEEELWNTVQAQLSANISRKRQTRIESGALLGGLIFDDRGNRMSPSHARKAGVKYRYYLSSALLNGAPERAGSTRRVPAVEIMIGTALIRDCIREAKRTPEIPAIITQGTTQYGMQTFDQCLLKLYRDSVVSYETAREAATNPDDFDLKVRGIFSTGELTFEVEKKKQEEAAAKPPTSSPFFRRP